MKNLNPKKDWKTTEFPNQVFEKLKFNNQNTHAKNKSWA
jgi:uncharacterized protein YozE (UPF0346 family)